MQNEVELRVSPDVDVDATTSLQVATMAADAWSGLPNSPHLAIVGETRTTPGYSRTSGENGIYRMRSWRYGSALAVTVTTANADTGAVLDSDILVSPRADLRLFDSYDESDDTPSDRGSDGRALRFDGYDLVSVMTHEMGHLLGLGESEVREATMYAATSKGSVETRTLDRDDEEGIVAIYEGRESEVIAAAGCTTSPHSGTRTALGMFAAVALLALMRSRGSLSAYAFALVTLTALFGFDGSRLGAPSELEALTLEPAQALVIEAETVDEDGLFWTRCELELANGEHVWTEIPGGRIGSLTQVVGHDEMPRVGEYIDLDSEAVALETNAALDW